MCTCDREGERGANRDWGSVQLLVHRECKTCESVVLKRTSKTWIDHFTSSEAMSTCDREGERGATRDWDSVQLLVHRECKTCGTVVLTSTSQT